MAWTSTLSPWECAGVFSHPFQINITASILICCTKGKRMNLLRCWYSIGISTDAADVGAAVVVTSKQIHLHQCISQNLLNTLLQNYHDICIALHYSVYNIHFAIHLNERKKNIINVCIRSFHNFNHFKSIFSSTLTIIICLMDWILSYVSTTYFQHFAQSNATVHFLLYLIRNVLCTI